MLCNREETEWWPLPLCSVPISDDNGGEEKVMGSWINTSCTGNGRVVVGESTWGGPQTLSLSLVPGESSTSPWAWQSVWVRHFIILDSTSEKVPLVHGLQSTSSVSLPRLLTLNPGGHSEWGLHSEPPSPDRKLFGGHVHTRSWVDVQGTFSMKPAAHGAWQRWHCSIPFSPRVKVPSGQGLHSLTAAWEQWTDTYVPAGHLLQTSLAPESWSVCW